MAINLLSPIAKMPFGRHKGIVLWTLGVQYLSYLTSQDITQDTKDTIEAAYQLIMNKGSYAVLTKSATTKWKVTLKGIYSSEAVANSHCEGADDFVYHISNSTTSAS